MPVFDTFTKRKKQATRAGEAVKWQYEDVPQELRTQVVYILMETLGGYREPQRFDFNEPPRSNKRWEFIRNTVARERGVFTLTRTHDNPFEQCVNLLLTGTGDDALEIVEMAFRYIDTVMRQCDDWGRQQEGLKASPDEAIEELNHRLLEHSVGYRFDGGLLVRIDSDYLHREVTEPAIRLLHEEGFDGALEEFTNAHAHYRKGETRDANVDALNALESTLKAICDANRWKYSPSANGAGLISLVVQKELIPAELQGQFNHLIDAMKSGLPPVRHNFGGHGQGATIKVVGRHLSAYSLHLMAANIVLLIQAHQALKTR
jgi:hypothetical protein